MVFNTVFDNPYFHQAQHVGKDVFCVSGALRVSDRFPYRSGFPRRYNRQLVDRYAQQFDAWTACLARSEK